MGELRRGMVADGGVRALRVDVRDIVAEGARLHGLTGAAREWYADGLVASALLSAYLDDDERLTVQLQASVPRFAFTCDVNSNGRVRARLSPANVGASEHVEGLMYVLKSVVGREVYRGITEVSHDSFAAMLQDHLTRSLQTLCRVRVSNGVGAFVELLPGGGLVALDRIVDDVLEGLDGTGVVLEWGCGCSEDRVLAMIRSLGQAEIRSMLAEDGGAVVDCHYCTRRVSVSGEQLEALLR